MKLCKGHESGVESQATMHKPTNACVHSNQGMYQERGEWNTCADHIGHTLFFMQLCKRGAAGVESQANMPKYTNDCTHSNHPFSLKWGIIYC